VSLFVFYILAAWIWFGYVNYGWSL